MVGPHTGDPLLPAQRASATRSLAASPHPPRARQLTHPTAPTPTASTSQVGAAAPPRTILASAGWPMTALAEALSDATGVPISQLALARPPARQLTPQLLSALVWDEPELLAASRLSGLPLNLGDADVLVVRDRMHPPPAAALSPSRRPFHEPS